MSNTRLVELTADEAGLIHQLLFDPKAGTRRTHIDRDDLASRVVAPFDVAQVPAGR